MLLHLPISMLVTLSPITVSDTLPNFDIARECRFESESTKAFVRCSQDEADALQQLKIEWPRSPRTDRNACFTETTVAGFASYVELLICLEMARDVSKERANASAPAASIGSPSTHPAPSELSVVDKHD